MALTRFRRSALALARFALLGAALFVLDRAWAHATRRPVPLRVEVPRGLDAGARARRADEAMLLEEAIALGWAESDPIVRARLVDNLRFLHPDGGPLGLDEAYRLDMHRKDLVVRRRLVGRMERMLSVEAASTQFADAELLAYRDAHAGRYQPPPRVRYAGVFVARERHPSDFDDVVATLGRRLREGRLGPDEASALGDPLLYAPGNRFVTVESVANALGGELGARLATAPIATWSGPYRSTFGAHFVYVHARVESPLPGLDVLRARLLSDMRSDARDRSLRARMRALRANYTVELVERGDVP